MALLEISNLSVEFPTTTGWFKAVDGVSLSVAAGSVHAIVGESGSGKSVAMLAVMGLLPKTARVTADAINFDGKDLYHFSDEQRRSIIGREITMIFQEPMTSLNPCFTVGFQLDEAISSHLRLDKAERRARCVSLLRDVGIPDAEARLSSYPHQFSGGMAQRVMIAMALACNPKLIIADEPTTALDVTIQAQILDLLRNLQKSTGMALVLITHSMGVVAEMADKASVHYAGQKVEEQNVDLLFTHPRHPYTTALLASLPERARGGRLIAIPGTVPGPMNRPKGCLFAPRCTSVKDICQHTMPSRNAPVLCHFPHPEGHAA